MFATCVRVIPGMEDYCKKTATGSESGNDLQTVIPVGGLSVKVRAPRDEDDPDERISFWWGVTSASIALARHLESMEDLSHERVLELGCGLGLAGITAAMLGARVCFSDYVPKALSYAQINCAANGIAREHTEFRIIDWENPGDLPSFSIVMGSEVLYDYFSHGSLLDVLDRATHPRSTIIMADRKRLVVSRFIGRLISRGYVCTESSYLINVNEFPEQEISVFTLTRQ